MGEGAAVREVAVADVDEAAGYGDTVDDDVGEGAQRVSLVRVQAAV